jgi:hypothetical protein
MGLELHVVTLLCTFDVECVDLALNPEQLSSNKRALNRMPYTTNEYI